MTIDRTGHVFFSKRFVGKFDFIEQVGKCRITTYNVENVSFRELVLSNELKNVEPYHRERFGELAPVVQTVDSAVHRISHYPADKS